MKKPPVQRVLFTIREVAQVTGLSMGWIRDLVRRKVIPAYRLGQGYLIHVDDLNRWLEAHRTDRPEKISEEELKRWIDGQMGNTQEG
jgi:excisionase family DNA binding protein